MGVTSLKKPSAKLKRSRKGPRTVSVTTIKLLLSSINLYSRIGFRVGLLGHLGHHLGIPGHLGSRTEAISSKQIKGDILGSILGERRVRNLLEGM